MSHGRFRLRPVDALAAVLFAGVAAYGAVAWAAWLETREVQRMHEAMGAASQAIARRVDALVVSDDDGRVQSLSDVAAGKCRYVVIGTEICPHTITAVARWTLTALNDPAGADMPEGWATFWVAADEMTGSDDLFGSDFPVPTHFARDRLDLINGAGMA